MTSVSIVIATFNGERFLAPQLESLRTQLLAPHEVIVSDDGSSDRTLSIVERFASTVSFPVKILRNPKRLGYGGNFLSAATHASGDLIAFCDQDDVWEPEKLTEACKHLAEAGADLLVHTLCLINEEGQQYGLFRQQITRTEVYEALALPPWGVYYGMSMVFKRELFFLLNPAERGGHTFEFDGLLSHDLWIYFLGASFGKVVALDKPLARYRRHNANETPNVGTAWLARMKLLCGVSANPHLRRDSIARGRAALSERVAVSHPHRAQQARRAALFWTRIARIEAARIDLYSTHSVVKRALAWSKLAMSGGYFSARSGGIGGLVFIRDLAVGVFRIGAFQRRLA